MTKHRASNSSLFLLLVLSLAGLAVQCGSPPGPTKDPLIVLSATSRSFTATQGGASPAVQTVMVSNGGDGTLSGLTATVSFTTGQGWLAASLSSTTAPSTLTLTATTGTLVAGTYTATVAVTATGVSNSPQTVSVTFTLAPSAPAAPSNLAATAVSSSQINLSWTDNATNEDGFQIERCSGAACTAFAQIATVGSNGTAYSNTGLAASTSYSYRVRANNGAGSSAYSNTATATTSVTVPAAPTNLIATVVSSSQINLSWTDNATNEDGFRIEECVGAGCTNFIELGTVAANATSEPITGTLGGTTYSHRIRAYNTAGNSAYSNVATATTPATALKIRILDNASSAQKLHDVVRLKLALNVNGFGPEDLLSDDRYTMCQSFDAINYISPGTSQTFNQTIGANYSVFIAMGVWETDFFFCTGTTYVWDRTTSYQTDFNGPLYYVYVAIDITNHTSGTVDFNVVGSYLSGDQRVVLSQNGTVFGTVYFTVSQGSAVTPASPVSVRVP